MGQRPGGEPAQPVYGAAHLTLPLGATQADDFFQANGSYSMGSQRERVAIEVNHDISAAVALLQWQP